MVLAGIALVALGACHCWEGKSASEQADGAADVALDAISVDTASDDAAAEGAALEASTEADSTDDAGAGWTAVAGTGGCALYSADVSIVKFAPVAWTSCGAGCLVSAESLGAEPINRGTTAGKFDGAETYLILDQAVPAGIRLRTVRVSDGTTLAATELRKPECLPLGTDNDAFWYGFAGPKGSNTFIFGHGSPTGAITWSGLVPAPGAFVSTFEWNSGYGLVFENGAVQSIAPASATYTALDTAVNTMGADASGDLAVWSRFDSATSRAVIRGYEKTRGKVETYAQHPTAQLVSAAVSKDALVTVGVTGALVADAKYDTATFLWSKRPAGPSDVVLMGGAAIPAKSGTLEVRTAGDFASVIACDSSIVGPAQCRVFVTQLSTSKGWRINPRPGEVFSKLLAASEHEVFVGVSKYPGDSLSVHEIARILRFDFSNLDELSKAW